MQSPREGLPDDQVKKLKKWVTDLDKWLRDLHQHHNTEHHAGDPEPLPPPPPPPWKPGG